MASTEHCLLCFEALDAKLNNRTPLSLPDICASWAAFKPPPRAAAIVKNPALQHISPPALSLSSSSSSSSTTSLAPSTAATSPSAPSTPAGPSATPLFVTWNTVSSSDGDEDVALRGCIGTFEAQVLAHGLPEYAVISALHDSRFPPVTAAELPSLRAAVTLLTDFEEVDDPYDWEVGVHGVRLSFTDKGRRFGATYLPDVAAEQGWSKEEALFSLVRKAGWMGSRSRWGELELRVTRYQGKKKSLDYAEYKKWRDWKDCAQV